MASEVRFNIVKKQLEKAGYRLARVSGSHHIFEKPGQTLLSIPVHRGRVKPNYARQVKRIIEAEAPEADGDGA
jgi:predicted RNA binding protein YcfA (HicA-like mRNA interferase family)